MEYYTQLKNILNEKSSYSGIMLQNVKRLNNEILEICKLFERYLNDFVQPAIDKSEINGIQKILEIEKINYSNVQHFRDQFAVKYQHLLFDGLDENENPYDFRMKFDKEDFYEGTCALNFNYTNTISKYIDIIGDFVINIHGELNNPINKILLGFGDETDDTYKQIENLNVNEFLRFMKSSHYLKNSGYKKLFDFIEVNNFQVQIFGHSCSLSDRTLLKAIFEHKNCISIKPYYYRYKNENEYGEWNDFDYKIKNISRHFPNKIMMRDKVVNFDYCDALPQSEV